MPAPVTCDVARAVAALRAGGLVGMPTETVYGLGASIAAPSAVARVYAVKGRPADHPLIVHIADASELRVYAASVPDYADALAQACWPGPLTLVLPKSAAVGDFVTGGQDTVALRVPDHPAALDLLRGTDAGLAAPSANRFGRVSPTTAAHVAAELGLLLDPARDVILDGGPTRVGLESTIVDCTGPRPRLLRPGGVSAQQVAAIAGLPLAQPDPRVRAPGTLPTHYAPTAQVQIIADAGSAEPTARDPIVGLIAPCEVPTPAGLVRLLAPTSDAEYAAGLYAALRDADELQLQVIRVVLPGTGDLAPAIRDRVQRAAASNS